MLCSYCKIIKNENIKTDIDNYLIKYKEHLDIINCETP